jgi:predicted nucleic-acid-binding protein
MLAVDTNIIIRFLTDDDPEQSPRAHALIAANDIWVGTTVILEAAWVLRSIYHCSPTQVCEAFRLLGGLPRLKLENAVAIHEAIALHEAGMDFADALHFTTASNCEAFVTFDGPCLETAQELGLAVRQP